MLSERKLAGILVQAAEGALIAGIGLNVNQSAFPSDLEDIATSLKIETGREHSKEALAERVIAESLRYAPLREARNPEAASKHAPPGPEAKQWK